MDKIIEKIHNSTGLLNNIYESNVIEKPSYKMYMFSSEEPFKDGIYQSYTLFYIHDDVRYLQIFLYESPDLLTDSDKRYMSLYTGLRK